MQIFADKKCHSQAVC